MIVIVALIEEALVSCATGLHSDGVELRTVINTSLALAKMIYSRAVP